MQDQIQEVQTGSFSYMPCIEFDSVDIILPENKNPSTQTLPNANPIQLLCSSITSTELSNNPFQFESDFTAATDDQLQALFKYVDLIVNPLHTDPRFAFKVKDFLREILTQDHVDM